MKRQRRTKKGHDYSVLEPRQLLATTGLAQFDGDTSIDTGLIVNGNFDQSTVAGGTSERFDIDDVPGWSQSSGAADQVSLVGFNDSPRATGFHLDSQADVLESLFQDVSTERGQQYTLAFDLLGRSAGESADASTNDLRVLWDGVEVGTYRGITDFWQSFTVDVTGGVTDSTRLEIQEVDGAGNDGIGAMLDNLRLIPVTSETLENGSFEDNESGTIAQENLPGWNIVGEQGQRSADIQSGSESSDGSRFLNLDRQSDNSDILYTDVATEAGGMYFLSFDLRSESGEVGQDEEVRVRWNNQWAGTYRGNADWQSFGFTVEADSDSTRLVFREPGGSFTGDGDGPLLDNIRITKVSPSISVSLNETSAIEFTENGAGLDLGSRIDSINSIVSGSVTGFTASLPDASISGESLLVDGPSATLASVDGVLEFTDDLTTDEFLAVLQTLRYENISDNPVAGPRPISVVVNAGSTASPAAIITVNVNEVNDAPVISGLSDEETFPNVEFNAQATAIDAEGDDVTWSISATGSAADTTDSQPAIDEDGNITWTPVREGVAVMTVRATDAQGVFSEQQFEVTVAAGLDTGTVLVNSGTDLPLFDSTAATDPAIGQTIADFEAQTISGESFNSIEPGVARIYSVLAHWCPFCQQELPEISEWLVDNDLGTDVEFVAAAVSVDPSRDNYPPAEWFDREDFNGTIIVDNPQAKLMDIFGTRSFPFLVAVDASGQVVERFSGVSTTAQLNAALAAVRGV